MPEVAGPLPEQLRLKWIRRFATTVQNGQHAETGLSPAAEPPLALRDRASNTA